MRKRALILKEKAVPSWVIGLTLLLTISCTCSIQETNAQPWNGGHGRGLGASPDIDLAGGPPGHRNPPAEKLRKIIDARIREAFQRGEGKTFHSHYLRF
jgi:hypothetical protein